MPSITSEPVSQEAERAEMQAVLHSQMFARSPVLTRLLSYLCEKAFTGQTEQIKEYSLAIDVLDRQDSFDPDVDSIVRVQANRQVLCLGRRRPSAAAYHSRWPIRAGVREEAGSSSSRASDFSIRFK